MPRSFGQKQKILRLLDILKTETDAEHPLSAQELIARLETQGISAERKSLYDDLHTLEAYGVDVESTPDHRYYIGERAYELAELKTLVDIIQSAKFLTPKKSNQLTKKLYAETSRYGAAELDRQIHVARTKALNENIYYTIDAIHAAIRDNCRITFSYFHYNVQKKAVEHHPGRIYEVSPWILVFNDENYYLVAYSEADQAIRHYRLDRMRNVSATERPRNGEELFRKIDVSVYESKAFGMFRGEETLVTLHCKNEAADAIIDRFGTEPTFFTHADGTFDVTVRVFDSPQFYGWLTGLGELIRILAPREAVNGYKAHLTRILQAMEEGENAPDV